MPASMMQVLAVRAGAGALGGHSAKPRPRAIAICFIRYTATQKPDRETFSCHHNKTTATEISGTALQSLKSLARKPPDIAMRHSPRQTRWKQLNCINLWPLASIKTRVRNGQSHGPCEPRACTAGKLTPTSEQETQRPAVRP